MVLSSCTENKEALVVMNTAARKDTTPAGVHQSYAVVPMHLPLTCNDRMPEWYWSWVAHQPALCMSVVCVDMIVLCYVYCV